MTATEAEGLWGIDALPSGFYLEGISPIHGWFCIEVSEPREVVEQLHELGFPDATFRLI